MDKIIEVSGLKKSYGKIEAVRDISFYVERGKLFSYLGPNGAGKSTTIDILCTLLSFEQGEVIINGFNIRNESYKIRELIGVVYQDNMLDALLTVGDNLALRAGFYYKSRHEIKAAVSRVAEITDINEYIKRPYGKLSGGQRRRADIARALLNTPTILFLDEPTTGLDPQTRMNIWQTVERLKDELGMTVFLTTHYMEEAAKSDFIIVMDHGEIVAKGTPTALKNKYTSDVLKLKYTDKEKLEQILKNIGAEYSQEPDVFKIIIPDTMASLAILEKAKNYIDNFEVMNGTMDDAFLGITGKELRE